MTKPQMALLLALLGFSSTATAATYKVGPTRTQKTPSTAFLATLKAGDVVEIDGNQTYGAFSISAKGTQAAPITLRGIKVNGKRPVIQSSGGFTVHNDLGAYLVFESLELTGGDVCYRHHGANIVLRDLLIHHCRDGVLGTDEGSGSLTMEYCELHNNGQSDSYHQIYMATDEHGHPGSVFRLQFSYIHDGVGGNNVKSRAERNEIYHNWIEGARYHELELIGPDQSPWDPTGDLLPREDADVVGNVLYSKTSDGSTVRVGGDGTGGTQGRYRFINNTFLLTSKLEGAAFRLFQKLESLEVHNNAFYVLGGGAVRAVYQQGLDANWDIQTGDAYVWKDGVKVMGGANNWVSSTITAIPVEWTGTLKGTDPGFTNLATLDLRPKSGSPLVDAGINKTVSPAGHAFPSPLALPAFTSPGPLLIAVGSAAPRTINGTAIDIGAFERSGAPQLPPKADAGTPPPDSGLPPPAADDAGAGDDRSVPPADSAVATSDGAPAQDSAGVAADGALAKDGTVSAGDGESRPRPTEGCNHTPGGAGASPLSLLALLGVVAWRRSAKRG